MTVDSLKLDRCKLNDCWNRVGVWGSGECPELKRALHCHNCDVYSSAAALLLEQELPKGYLDNRTAHFATATQATDQRSESALVFRIGPEWLAFPPIRLQEIVEYRPIHSVPHLQKKALLGLANIRGELLICVTLDELLNKVSVENRGSKPSRPVGRRLIVANREGSRFAFPVDEVLGIHRFGPKELKEVPVTLAKAKPIFTRGILHWQSKTIGLLDEQLLFGAIDRILA